MSSSVQVSITLLEGLNAGLREKIEQQRRDESRRTDSVADRILKNPALVKLATSSMTVSLLAMAGSVLAAWH